MTKTPKTLAAAACIAGALAACTSDKGSTVLEEKQLGDSKVLLTSADVRMTISKPASFDSNKGRVVPSSVVCTEPSPDIAKAVQESFGMGGSLGITLPEGPSAAAALSVAKARAESAAQLGERLATIQLLRDGLFRACEAYANGTFSEVTYAVLLSRYDDAMVSLLMGELAAGNFGRSLATLSGDADSTVAANANVKSALDHAASTSEEAKRKEEEAKQAEQEAEDKEAKLAAAKKKDPDGDHSKLESDAKSARNKSDAKRFDAVLAAETSAKATATANATAAGAISHQPSDEAVKVLHEMQRKYLENINSDALVVACVTEMASRKSGDATVLTDFCTGVGKQPGALQQVLTAQGEILEAVKSRAIQKRDAEAFAEAVQHFKQMQTVLSGLSGETKDTPDGSAPEEVIAPPDGSTPADG